MGTCFCACNELASQAELCKWEEVREQRGECSDPCAGTCSYTTRYTEKREETRPLYSDVPVGQVTTCFGASSTWTCTTACQAYCNSKNNPAPDPVIRQPRPPGSCQHRKEKTGVRDSRTHVSFVGQQLAPIAADAPSATRDIAAKAIMEAFPELQVSDLRLMAVSSSYEIALNESASEVPRELASGLRRASRHRIRETVTP